MRKPLVALAAALLAAPTAALADPPRPPAPAATLTPLGSAAALRAAIAPVLTVQQRALARQRARDRPLRPVRGAVGSAAMPSGVGLGSLGSIGMGPSATGTGIGAGYGSATRSTLSDRSAAAAAPSPAAPRSPGAPGTSSAPASITNNQEAGVDEGDIVKVHDHHLIVLRRGRLFTVHVGEAGARALTPRAMLDAFGPGQPPADWYDELLVDGDTVLVTGYSYDRQQTEIGRFSIAADGALRYRDTLYLRTGDYFSARNYASRLVGHQLVVYMPVPMIRQTDRDDFVPQALPTVRLGRRGAWRPVMDYGRVYGTTLGFGSEPVLHTVLRCDLSRATPDCRAEGVLGPGSRSFYVSRSALYLWVTGEGQWEDYDGNTHRTQRPGAEGSVLYRFPLTGGALTAVRTQGAPVDQFSFRDQGGALRVVVRAESQGDGMWASELSAGAVALLTVPQARFGRVITAMEPRDYRPLPTPEEPGAFQNRFVAGTLLYGTGSGWFRRASTPTRSLYVHDLAAGRTARLALPHSVDRIEPLDRDAVVIGGADNDLHFSAIALEAEPTVAGRHVREGAAQSEMRSHGFFYLPQGDRRGMLGLPLTRGGRPGWRQLRETGAEVTFLRVEGLQFRPMGSLRAEGGAAQRDDACVASCADWYGNARPIFWRDRVFALLGYELIEGALDGDTLSGRAHVDFFAALRPAAAIVAR
jgi:hypothetical protein